MITTVQDREGEPEEAFPYTPPTEEIKKRYKHIFEMSEPLKPRISKLLIDKIVSSLLLAGATPVIFILRICYFIEGLIIPENKGPMLFYYWGVSGGQRIKKWKIRLIKTKYIESML